MGCLAGLVGLLALTGCGPKGVALDAPETGAPDSTPHDTGDTAGDSGETDTHSGGDSGGDSGADSNTDSATDTGEPLDEDGDGHSPAEVGGDDCDDHDPTTWGGAPEWCDAVDHDCDGVALEPGDCARTIDLDDAVPTWLRYGDVFWAYAGMAPTGDLDADGRDELFLWCSTTDCEAVGDGVLYEWPFDTEGVTVMPDRTLHRWFDDGVGTWVGTGIQPAGDVDGDGATDLMIPVLFGEVGIYVDTGPFPMDGSERHLSSLLRFTTPTVTDEWGWSNAAGRDFDGDGNADFQVTIQDSKNWTDVVSAFVFGSPTPGDAVELRGHFMQGAFDVDLDGCDDPIFLIGDGDDRIGWVPGCELRTIDGANVADVAIPTWPFDAQSEGSAVHSLTDDFHGVGDWNGDGYQEVVSGCGGCREDTDARGRIYVFGGDPNVPAGMEDAEGYWAASKGTYSSVLLSAQGDFDGDHLPDVIANQGMNGNDAGQILQTLLPAAQGIPAPGTPLDEVGLHMGGDYAGFSAFADFNGDGYDDILVKSTNSPPDTWATGFGVLYGWDVPWFDPTYW